MAMPKAPMHEDNFPARAEDDIRLSGKVRPMQPIAITHAMTMERTIISGFISLLLIRRMFSVRLVAVSLSIVAAQ